MHKMQGCILCRKCKVAFYAEDARKERRKKGSFQQGLNEECFLWGIQLLNFVKKKNRQNEFLIKSFFKRSRMK